jgi:hypothetical protein
MMRMMLAIDSDKNSFDGNREVTCYSCHRGSPTPAAIPVIASEAQPKQDLIRAATPEAENLSVNSPSADEIIGNYIQALGGATAIEKITSRKESGATTLGGKTVAVEILDQYPEKQAVVRHMAGGDSVTAFNGREGWSAMPGHPARDMHREELDAAQMDADLHFPLHFKSLFDELRVDYPEKIGTREAYVLFANRNGLPPVKLYFDEQSGLLVRVVRYADSPLGLDPTQIDYADYRDAGGVETPFRWTVAEAHESSTIQLEQVQQNVPIDNATFVKRLTPVAEQNPSAGSRK